MRDLEALEFVKQQRSFFLLLLFDTISTSCTGVPVENFLYQNCNILSVLSIFKVKQKQAKRVINLLSSE